MKKASKAPKKAAKKHGRGAVRVRTVKCPLPAREPPLPTSTIIPLEEPFTDARGYIQNLVSRDIGSAVLIHSEKGTVRAEHWHRRDAHWCFLLSGSLLYLERPVGSDEQPKVTSIVAGQLFFTPPNVEHSMVFTQASNFLTFSRPRFDRSKKSYEADLVRLTTRLSDLPAMKALITPPAAELSHPEVVEAPAAAADEFGPQA